MKRLIDLDSAPVKATLQILLKDKTTGKNIIWATDTYSANGSGFQGSDELTERHVRSLGVDVLQPRVSKSLKEQKERARVKAEVQTPTWLCNEMNNYADEDWFGYKNVFNSAEKHTWHTKSAKIYFPDGKKWQNYVDSRRIEITCGEAPFLVSRYNTVTGKLIAVTMRRVGLLDRKMRIVAENTSDYDKWLKWAIRAFQSCYGYEYKGDNLLIARINTLMSFCDYHKAKWGKTPDKKLLRRIANIIAWNIWQMDGLKGTPPLGAQNEEYRQLSLWDELIPQETKTNKPKVFPCVIRNWRSNLSVKWEQTR